jgi:integrase
MGEADAERRRLRSGARPVGQRAEPARTPVKERVKAHCRDGNEDNRRRGDDGSRGRPREHAASIASIGAQRGGGRGRWDDHGRTARLSTRAMGAAQEATLGRDLSAAACAAGGYPKAGGTAHGLRHSAATILLNQVGKDLREIQNCFATRISARPCAIPMSAMNRHGRRRKRSVTLWSDRGDRQHQIRKISDDHGCIECNDKSS